MTLAIRDIHTQIQTAAEQKDVSALAGLTEMTSAAIAAGKKLKKSQGELREYEVAYIWAMWELGKLLNEVAPHGGPRYQGGNLETTLATLGIDPKLSAKSRKLAEIHDEDVRTFITESGDEINLTYLLRLHTESETEPPAWDDDAEWRVVIDVLNDYLGGSQDEYRSSLVAGWLKEA